jgi:hypothetical protein
MQVTDRNDHGLCWQIDSTTASYSLHELVFIADPKQGSPAIGIVTGVVSIAGLGEERIELRWQGVVSRVHCEVVFLSLETTPTVEIVFNGVTWSVEYQLSLPMTLELDLAIAEMCDYFPSSGSSKKRCRSLFLDRQFDLLDLHTLNLNESSLRKLLQALEAK